jgi:hypothetical protein
MNMAHKIIASRSAILFHQSVTIYPVNGPLGIPEHNMASKNAFMAIIDPFIEQLPFELKRKHSYYGFGVGWIVNELLVNGYDAIVSQFDPDGRYKDPNPTAGIISFDVSIYFGDHGAILQLLCRDNGLGTLSATSFLKRSKKEMNLYFGGNSHGHEFISGIARKNDDIVFTRSIRDPLDPNLKRSEVSVEIPVGKLSIKREFKREYLSGSSTGN